MLLLLPLLILFVLLVNLALKLGSHLLGLFLETFGLLIEFCLHILEFLTHILRALFHISSHTLSLLFHLLVVDVALKTIFVWLAVLLPLSIALLLLRVLPLLVLATELVSTLMTLFVLVWIQDPVPQLVVFLLLFLVAEHVIGCIDLFEFVLVHTASAIWVILEALFVVHVLDVFLAGAFFEAKNCIVVLFWVEIGRFLLATTSTSPERSLRH